MLVTSNPIRPFDSADFFAGNRQSGYRLGLAIFLLNIAPFLYFISILNKLNFDLPPFPDYIFLILIIFSLSLSVFGYAKIFYSIIIAKREKFYSERDFQRLIKKNPEQKKGFSRHYSQHLYPGFLYVTLPIEFYFTYTDIINNKFPLCSLFIMSSSIILCIIAYLYFKTEIQDRESNYNLRL